MTEESQTEQRKELECYMASGWQTRASTPDVHELAQYAYRRRAALFDAVPNSTLIFPSGSVKPRTFADEYPFRVDSDFYWLTGFSQPDAVLVLDDGHATIYMHDRFDKTTSASYTDPRNGEFWIGQRWGIEETSAALSIECKPIAKLDDDMAKIDHSRIRVRRGVDVTYEKWNTDEQQDQELATEIAKLRMVKDEFEIQSMRDAIAITHSALDSCLAELPYASTLPNGERWIEGTFFRIARTKGVGLAYQSIVAAGQHATILHWQTNDGAIREGDLLLMDVGAESHAFYAADITRTFPVNGKFSTVQRDVYEIVLAAQKAGFTAAKPGAGFREPHEAAVSVLADGLVDLGVLQPTDSRDIHFGLHRRFMPHGTSHPLGLDVHDCLAAGSAKSGFGALAPGNVITMEPGLYFQHDDLRVPENLRGIGIRIEDDVLITHTGYEVLSETIPRSAEAVETWVQKHRPR